jgi:hypothetical protein
MSILDAIPFGGDAVVVPIPLRGSAPPPDHVDVLDAIGARR